MITPVRWLSCGFDHCVVLTKYGNIASWGYGASGCLGHGNYSSFTAPKQIETLAKEKIEYVECGGYHSAGITTEGRVFTWGRGDVG
jgi:alpha-tubulin suppressor-like RCC1 family protein